ncbi:TPA: LamG domain-containing protein [Candidatus Poribacteria bacterium]|nr:LamG domain-containing protein [Candidatus Poribacteria bacterium]
MKRIYIITAFLVALSLASEIAVAKIEEKDLLGLWLFDDGKGDVLKDSSGNGNDGTLINGPTWIDGKFGKALQFVSAKQQRVEIPNSDSLNPTDAITVMAWGYLEDKNGNRRFLQKSTPGSDNQYRLLLEWGNFRFDAGPGVSPKEIDVPIFSVQEWHHVAGVYDGAEIALYIDGEKAGSKAAKGQMIPSTGPIFLGTKWANAPEGDYWNGAIDEIAVIGRGVTEEEVKEAMQGFETMFAIEPAGKTAVTWGKIKSD